MDKLIRDPDRIFNMDGLLPEINGFNIFSDDLARESADSNAIEPDTAQISQFRRAAVGPP